MIALSQLKISVNLDNNPKAGVFQETLKLSSHITKNPWSPIVFKGGRRLETNFVFCDWAVLDYENGTTLEEALQTFCDCIHIIGTTKSHTAEAHRFRVCIPWSERISDLYTFRHNQKALIDRYDTDPQCKDGARFYFPCKEIISINAEGFRMEVKPAPAVTSSTAMPHEKTGFSSVVTFFMRNVIDEGKRNSHVYQVAKDLFRIGLSRGTVENIILKSPTYRDIEAMEAELLAEILQSISSAWRAVTVEQGKEQK